MKGDKRTHCKYGYYFLRQSNKYTLKQEHERHEQCTNIAQVVCMGVCPEKGTEFPYAVLIWGVLIVGCTILEAQFQKF